MKSKNLIILVAVLGILVIIYLIQSLTTSRKSVSESVVNIYPDFNSSSVSYIQAFKQLYPDSGLYFAKKDGLWVITSYYGAPARQTDIDKLLEDIKKLQGEVRSTNEGLFSDYDIGDDQALYLEFLGPDSTVIADILIGKGVPEASSSSFIRKAGSDTVYMANQNFLSRFAVWNADPGKRLTEKRWAELKMADFDKEKVNQIALKDNKKDYRFERQAELVKEDTTETTKYTWKQVEPAKNALDSKKIDDILNRLSNLRGSEIVGNEIQEPYGLENPKYSATVSDSAGQVYAYYFGAETDTTGNNFYAAVAGKPFVYKIAKSNFEALFVNPFKKD